jgi:hypothetical protein
MKKVYKYQNGTIYVTLPDSFNLDFLKEATEDYLKKVISEEMKNGNSNKSNDFTEKQISY